MAYGRRRYHRRRFTWRRRYSRRFGRRRYSRRFSRSRGTRSRTVKLTVEVNFQPQVSSTAPNNWNPTRVYLTSVPGFNDYKAVFSEYRVLKARLNITGPLQPDSTQTTPAPAPYNFLVVPSRPFAQTQVPVPSGGADPSLFLPAQAETALRQTRYQYIKYPSKVTNSVSIGFKPYTMISTGGPTPATVDTSFQRIWEGRKWSPFTWLNGTQNDAVVYFGPYVVWNSPGFTTPVISAAYGQLTLYCQFRGQK